MCHDGQREGDAFRRGLWRVLDLQDPRLGLAQKRRAREQAAGMAVGPAAQQQQVEHGQPHAVPRREDADEGLFVLIGEFLRIVEVLDVDWEDLWFAELGGDLVQNFRLDQAVVAIFVVERDEALVGVEDLPLVELELGVAVGLLEECLAQDLGQRAARDGDAEDSMAAYRGILGVEDVCAEGGRKLTDALEGV